MSAPLTDEQQRMVTSVEPLVRKLVVDAWGGRVDRETLFDMQQAALLEVCHATCLYRANMGARWSTYAGNRAIYACRRYLRDVGLSCIRAPRGGANVGQSPPVVSLDAMQEKAMVRALAGPCNTPSAEQMAIRRIVEQLDEFDQMLYKKLFGEGYTTADVARALGCSVTWAGSLRRNLMYAIAEGLEVL